MSRYRQSFNQALQLVEKWDKDVEVKSTGDHAGKTIDQLKREVDALRGKPNNEKEMGGLLFAIRAKQGWKKGEGSTGVEESTQTTEEHDCDEVHPDVSHEDWEAQKDEAIDTWHPDPEKDRKSTSMKHTAKAVAHHDAQKKKPAIDTRQAAKKIQDILKKQRERRAAAAQSEGNLPPHLSKFLDKKGNPNPEAAKRMAAGQKKRASKDVTPKGYGPTESEDPTIAAACVQIGEDMSLAPKNKGRKAALAMYKAKKEALDDIEIKAERRATATRNKIAMEKLFNKKTKEEDIPKGFHKMPDGTIMKDSEHKKEVYKPNYGRRPFEPKNPKPHPDGITGPHNYPVNGDEKKKKKANESDKPEQGKVYALTGKSNEPSIARGDSWKKSVVKKKPAPKKEDTEWAKSKKQDREAQKSSEKKHNEREARYQRQKAAAGSVKEDLEFKVTIKGIPPFYVPAKTAAAVKQSLRKQLKHPDDIESIIRVTKAAQKIDYRKRAQGKTDEGYNKK